MTDYFQIESVHLDKKSCFSMEVNNLNKLGRESLKEHFQSGPDFEQENLNPANSFEQILWNYFEISLLDQENLFEAKRAQTDRTGHMTMSDHMSSPHT